MTETVNPSTIAYAFLCHCEERSRRGNPGPHARKLVHVALDCRAEGGSRRTKGVAGQ